MPDRNLELGADGLLRCSWGTSPPIYVDYHDNEWGKPAADETAVFEKVCLEGFQAGLSWLTVLRKRPAFREVFHDFEPAAVAAMSDDDVDALLVDERIIRHRGKIEATINNAQCLLELHASGSSLLELFHHAAPAKPHAPRTLAEIPSTTPESEALSHRLRELGFRFVGPTTCYAALQALGIVNDHLISCHAR